MEQRLNDNGKLFEKNFGELGLGVELVKAVDSPRGETYHYNLKVISNYNKNFIKSLVEIIAIYHHLKIDLVDSEQGHFAIFVHQKANSLSLNQCMRENHQRQVVIGKDINGELVEIDFEKIPHLLIAGTTGSGKSVLIHNLLVNLLSCYRVGNNDSERFRKGLELVIIDPKGNELDMYKNCRNVLFVDETKKAIQVLEHIVSEMDRRYKSNITTNNDLFIVIDELADLMLTSKFQVEESLVRIAQKGRALGIHLIVATQSPRVAVISGLIKANMPYRIALKTASARDSVVILDHKGAEQLEGQGDSIVRVGLLEKRTQIAYCEKELEAQFIEVNK